MDFNKAINIIRRELVTKDEPLKALRLLELLDIKGDLYDKTYGMLRHVFSEEEFDKAYNIRVDDCELIEPEECVLNAGKRYERYDWVINEVKNEKAKSFIDLGCYIGSLVATISFMGVKAAGIEYTDSALEVARRRAKKYKLDCKFYKGARDLKVNNINELKSDIVSSMEVLEHVIDERAYINYMCDLCNPGGWCLVSTPNGPYGDGAGNIKGGWEWRGEKDYRGHIRVFNKNTLKQLLIDCNCEIGLLTTGKTDQLLWTKFRRKHD